MTEPELKIIENNTNDYISMFEASKLCSYSQEYLGLLARRGKLEAKKIGRNWFTTEKNLKEYLSKQTLLISVPKSFISRQISSEHSQDDYHQALLSTAPASESLKSSISENSGSSTADAIIEAISDLKENSVIHNDREEKIVSTLDKLSDSISRFTENVTEKSAIKVPSIPPSLSPEQEEFIDVESQTLGYRIRRVGHYYSNFPKSPSRLTAIIVAAIVIIFVLVGGFSFGNADLIAEQIRKVLKDSDTLQGHFPGTHANEVLVLDKSGNISIFGHVETQGQFQSLVPDGVAPIVVDSLTKVENLNADYIDDLDSKDFTLAFVTKNGNVTYEDVKLEGNVEIGKTLTLKGPFKLLNELNVYGRLGVFADAFFSKDVTLTGGNLRIEKGTIEINNRSQINNLNAELLQGQTPNQITAGITLDRVVTNGNSTNKVAFFNGGLYGGQGAFASIGVAGSAGIGSSADPSKSGFTVYSNKYILDVNGNVTASGRTTTQELKVNGEVFSDLVPSGSFDLGSLVQPWENLYATNLIFNSASVSTNFEVSGYVSASAFYGADLSDCDAGAGNKALNWSLENGKFSCTDDDTGSGSSLEIGHIGAQIAHVSTLSFDANQFNITNIASEGFVRLDWTNGPASRAFNETITGFWNFTAASTQLTGLELTGIASIGGEVNLKGGLEVANTSVANVTYSRLGISTTTHIDTVTAANDLLISGDLEVDASAAFDSHVVVGDATDGTDTITVNAQIRSHLIPFNNAYDVGSTTNRWRTVYADKIDANEIAGASVSFSGTTNETFTINSDNATADAENSQFVFERGTPTTNAQIQWDSVSKRFNLNFPIFLQTTNASEPANNYTKFTIKGTADQGSNDYFEIQNSTSSRLLVVEQGGRLIASGSFQAGGGSVATVSYSRFGLNNADHSLAVASDVLVSGILEADSQVFFDANASVSPKLEIYNVGNADLELSNTQNQDGIFRLRSVGGATTARLDILGSASQTFLSIASSGNITADTNTFFVDAVNNRVGIGTTGPTKNLHVFGSSAAPTSNNGTIGVGDPVSGTTGGITLGYFTSNFNYIQGWSSLPLFINPLGNNTVLNRDGGSVGIGDTTPDAKLDVAGSGIFDNELIVTNALQVGGATSAAYSRFGIADTGHALTSADDVLFSGLTEFNDFVYIDSGASISSNLEVSGYASASSLFGATLVQCSATQKLEWANGLFSCVADFDTNTVFNGIEIPNDAGVFSHVTSVSFDTNMFTVINTASAAFVKIDYANGPASRSNNETITGFWEFRNGASFSTTTNGLLVDLNGTGDFIISRTGTNYLTVTDAGVFTFDNVTLDTNTIGTTSGNLVLNSAGTLDVQDAATFALTLGVTGLTTLSNASVSFNVDAAKIGINAVNTDQTLEVGGTASVSSTLFANGALSVLGLATFSSNASISNTLEITGLGTSDDQLKITDSANNKTYGLVVRDGDFLIRAPSTSSAFSSRYVLASVASDSLGWTFGRPSSPSLAATFGTAGIALDIYVSGKYAYVPVDTAGLQIIDISNPSNPTLTGTYNTSGNALGIYVSGKYAYVGDNTAGLQIIDISNPSNPTRIGTYNTPGNAENIYVSGKYAYVTDNASGLLIIDISNSSAPTLAGSYNTPDLAEGLYVSGKYAYVGDNTTLQIIDISNPSKPSLVGTYDTPAAALGIYVSGKYVYVAGGDTGLLIIDISNPSNPILTGTYNTSGFAESVYVSGKYAYVADNTGGLQIVDISNPSTPTLTGAYDTSGNALDVYVSGKYAYVADHTSGLQIIDIGGLETHALYAGNISTSDITVYENIDVGNNLYVRNGLNVGNGGLLVNGPMALNASFSANTASLSAGDLFTITHTKGRLSGDALRVDLAASTSQEFFTGNFANFTTAGITRILFESSGSILASGAAQFGAGGAPTSVSYSRFGSSAATATWITALNDLLISGDLQTLGSAAFAGNVGIGIINPTGKLHVSVDSDYTSNTSAALKIANLTLVNRMLQFGHDGTSGYIQSVREGTAGMNLLLNPNGYAGGTGGNVGIGATTPEVRLDVSGNIQASASGPVDLILNATNEDDSKFTIRSTGTTARLDILGSASQIFLSIASSGNVGIGQPILLTNLQTAKLYVTSSNSFTNFNSAGIMAMQASTGGNFIQIGAGLKGSYIQALATGEETTSQPILLNPDRPGINGGNVGIGTNSVDAKFEIEGNGVIATNVASISGTGITSGNILSLTGGVTTGNAIRVKVPDLSTGTLLSLSGTCTPLCSISGSIASISSPAALTGNGLRMELNGLSTGYGINLRSAGNVNGTGALLNIAANSASTGTIASISATGLTSGRIFDIVVAASSSTQGRAGASLLRVTAGGVVTASLSTGGTLSLRGKIFTHAGGIATCTGVNTPNSGCIDYAESYPTTASVSAGDVVTYNESSGLQKATSGTGLLGIVSTNPAALITGQDFIFGAATNTPIPGMAPVAMAGRVPVKISFENGSITAGDHLAPSTTRPGFAKKATQAGMMVGTALNDLDSSACSTPDKCTVLMFVNTSYWAPSNIAIQQTASGSSSVIVNNSSVDILGTIANAAEVVMQKIRVTGDIIAQGIKKTYFVFSEALPNIDPSTWGQHQISIAPEADQATKDLFTGNAAQAADQSKVDLAQDNGNYLATYGVDSTRGEIQLSGTSELVNGEARIFFDQSFTAIISNKVPLRVFITPITDSIHGQLYVATKTQYGFVVKELNGQDAGKFDWLVIARRKGYDQDAAINPTVTPIPVNITSQNTTASPSPSISTAPEPSVSPSTLPSPTISPLTTPEPTISSSPEPSPSVSATPEPSPLPTVELTP